MIKKHISAFVVAATLVLPAIESFGQVKPKPGDLTQLRPPTPGKQDSDSPIALSMLIAVAIVGLVATANLIASNRSHQD